MFPYLLNAARGLMVRDQTPQVSQTMPISNLGYKLSDEMMMRKAIANRLAYGQPSGEKLAEAAGRGEIGQNTTPAQSSPVKSLSSEVKTPASPAPQRAPQEKLDNFNYDREKGILAKKAALANQLMAAKGDEGRMIGGWYSSGGIGSGLGALAQNLVGGYLSGKSDEDARNLDKQQMEAYTKAASFDPTAPGPDVVTPGPVIPPEARQSLANQLLGGEQPQMSADPNIPPQQGLLPNVPPPQTSPMPDMMSYPTNGPDVVTPGAAPDQNQIMANRAMQMQALMNSGPLGQAQVNAMLARKDPESQKGRYQISAPTDTSPGYKFDTMTGQTIPLTEGERQMSIRDQIAVSKENRAQQEEALKNAGTREAAVSAVTDVDAGLDILDGILGGPKVNGVPSAIDKSTGAMAGAKEFFGNVFKTGSDAGDIKNDINIAMGKIQNASIALMRANGASSSTMNSDKDMQLITAATTVLEKYEKGQLSPEAAYRAITEAREAGLRVRERFANKANSTPGAGSSQPPPFSNSAAPPRGQSYQSRFN